MRVKVNCCHDERIVNARTVNPTKFVTELKRRNVYRAAVAYGVVAWFLTQLTTQVFPLFEIPNSAMRFVVIALVVGFPIAMLLAWVYEFTPEGIVRTEDLDPVEARSVQRRSGRLLDFIIIGALLLVRAYIECSFSLLTKRRYATAGCRSKHAERIPEWGHWLHC